jgi:hypothetical protein
MYLLIALAVVVGLLAYAFVIRPALRARPSLNAFWISEGAFFEAIRLKIAGLKAWLTTWIVGLAFVVLELNDMLAPVLGAAGFDTHTLLPWVPAQAWPVITIGFMLLLQYFRKIAARREAAGGAPV